MIHSNETSVTFYQELGKIFYAIAAVDGQVRKEEMEALRAIVRSEWIDLDQKFDEFGTDSAYQIEIVFDWFDDQNLLDTAKVLENLEAFKRDHPSLFTQHVKFLILKTAHLIASSFHGNNKSELLMLSRLEGILTTK